jgi:regulator of sigma E protease
MTTILIALFVFGILVVFHEFGHFSIAKLVGIKVHEFSVGMGPRIFKISGKETEYSIRILPLGGFVKMEGEDEASTDERSFNNKPVWARFLVVAAGSIMNFVLAILLFIIIFYSIGFPTTIVKETAPGFPAEKAGILPGDKITAIDGMQIHNWDKIVETINDKKDKEMEIIILRNDEQKKIHVRPIINEDTKQVLIGISPTTKKSFFQSIKISFDRMLFVIRGMFGFFAQIFEGKASTDDVVGPVGIIHLVGEAAKFGIYNVMSLAALISVNLGMINLLPIPALDGARLVFLAIEGIIGKPIDPEKEGFVHFVGFVLLMGLMLFIVYKDIIRFY